MAGTLLSVIAGGELGLWIARPALLLYLAVQWRRQRGMASGLLLVGLVTALAVLFLHDDPLPLLVHALDRFCFFATFVSALGLLRIPAMRSPLVRQAGQVLIRQKPAWRYPTLFLGSAIFGMIVNIGVLNMFGAMVQRSNSLRAAGGNPTLQKVRERRMIIAILRGYGMVPLVSPLSITLAVILSSMPQLNWMDIVPLVFPTAAIVFLIGWSLDWLTRPRNLQAPARESASNMPLLYFCLLAAAVTLAVFAVHLIFDLRLPLAVLVACPISAFTWLAMQRRRLHGGTGSRRAVVMIGRHARLIFGSYRGEVAVLGGSAFFGALLTPLIDSHALASALLAVGLHGFAAAMLFAAVIIVLSQLGLNPIVSVTLIASLFPDTHAIGLEPAVLATTFMTAWAISMLVSPFTASMMILAELVGRSPYAIAWLWNGSLFAILVPVMAAWLWLIEWIV